jgi:hypothetical protein
MRALAREGWMRGMTETARILVVANRTASTPMLLEEVGRRAGAGARFGLMVPPSHAEHADWSVDEARDLMARACRSDVELVEPGEDAVLTVHGKVADGSFGEVIVSTPRAHHLRWFHHDMPKRLNDLDCQVTVVPPEPDAQEVAEGQPTEWGAHAINPGATAGFGNY